LRISLERITVALAVAVVLSGLPGAGAGSGSRGRRRPRIELTWHDLELSRPDAADPSRIHLLTIEERLEERFWEVAVPLPSLVWITDAESGELVRRGWKAERIVFGHEPTKIALRRFRCYRVRVEELPDSVARDRYRARAFSILFFDPYAEPVGRIDGRRCDSRARFRRLLERTWRRSFSVRLKDFRREVTRILDRRTLLQERRKLLDWWSICRATGADHRGLRAELGAVQREIEALDEELREVVRRCRAKPWKAEEPAGERPWFR
jgi:hypothetical protein